MKIILSHAKPQCQHVDSGQCEHCKNFRSREGRKKGLQYNPFEILGAMINEDGSFKRNAFKFPFKIQRGSLIKAINVS